MSRAELIDTEIKKLDEAAMLLMAAGEIGWRPMRKNWLSGWSSRHFRLKLRTLKSDSNLEIRANCAVPMGR